jgi:hypothetical protein
MALPDATATDTGVRPFEPVVTGAAAAAAGLCWLVKAVAILATGNQPRLVFELAPALMAVAVLGLARHLPPGRVRTVSSRAAAVAVGAGVTVLAGQVLPLPELVDAAAMATANVGVLACLVLAGLSLRRGRGAHLPLFLGVATVPALLLGGLAAALFGERALEVPLVALGAGWVALGIQLFRGR